MYTLHVHVILHTNMAYVHVNIKQIRGLCVIAKTQDTRKCKKIKINKIKSFELKVSRINASKAKRVK